MGAFIVVCCFFFEWYGDHLDLHVLPHSFPTRRASDLSSPRARRTRICPASPCAAPCTGRPPEISPMRSEEHTSELQSLMRISYAVFCLKKKIRATQPNNRGNSTHTADTHRQSAKSTVDCQQKRARHSNK